MNPSSQILTDQLSKEKMWYLAHRYSNDEEKNFQKANKIAAFLFHRGIIFFSPISMSHPIDKTLKNKMKIIVNPYYWYIFDLKICKKCDGIILPPDWKQSTGCKKEYKYFIKEKKSIVVLSQELYDYILAWKP